MSGAPAMPFQLTGGAGYKANVSSDEILRKSSAYRKYSAAGRAQDADRRASQMGMDDDVQQALRNHQMNEASGRRGSVQNASGGAAVEAQSGRKGSVVVLSDNTSGDAMFGMESSAGIVTDPNRKLSTSLASDIFHKIKGDGK